MIKRDKKIKVVIADDHQIFRQGFRAMMRRQTDIEFAGEAANGEELLSLVLHEKPDIAFVDIQMPVMDGIKATAEILRVQPDTKTIALSMFNNDRLILDMIQAGASGYLLKNTTKEEVLLATITVANEGNFFGKSISEKISGLLQSACVTPQPLDPTHRFTEREIQVIE